MHNSKYQDKLISVLSKCQKNRKLQNSFDKFTGKIRNGTVLVSSPCERWFCIEETTFEDGKEHKAKYLNVLIAAAMRLEELGLDLNSVVFLGEK